MKIGVFISELLYQHDSVVLPGFGEFYSKYTPAKFIPEAGKVEAPTKTIAFNPGKREDDSLLVGYLSERQNMGKDEVRKFLEDFSAEINQLLETGKKVELERVGLFSKDESGVVSFEPDTTINYLNLPSGEVPEPPKKEAVSETPAGIPLAPSQDEHTPAAASGHAPPPPQTQNKEREVIIMNNQERPRLPSALRWMAFILVPLLIILIVLAINFDYFFRSGGIGSAFKRDRAAKETVAVPVDADEPAESGALLDEQPGDPATTGEAQPGIRPATGTPDTATAQVPAQEPPQRVRGQTLYYIVVGSFPEERKAEQLAQTLRNQGAPLATVFMQTGFNYHRVCYGYYNDLAEAENILPRVREEINPEAYILHR